MESSQNRKLALLRQKVVEMEKAIAARNNATLVALPEKLGYKSPAEFIAAFSAAVGAKRGRGRPASKPAPQGKRRRATITDATRAQVKKLVEDGKTGSEIAKALKISLPSVANIKKALGLTKARKK